MSTPVAPAAPIDQQPLSEGARIINTFTAPSKTFTDIRRSARWFVPWLVMAIFSYLFVAAVAQKVGWDQVVQNQIHLNPKQADRIDSMPPGQRQQALSLSVSITKGISYAIPVANLIFLAIIALVFMATFNFMLGAEIGFGQALAVVMYAWLPSIVKAILAVISLYAGASPESFFIDNPVASNLGALVDMAAHPALFRLLAAFDIFAIWILILEGIGFSCISKVKRGTALGVVFGWYALIVLLRVAWAAAFA